MANILSQEEINALLNVVDQNKNNSISSINKIELKEENIIEGFKKTFNGLIGKNIEIIKENINFNTDFEIYTFETNFFKIEIEHCAAKIIVELMLAANLDSINCKEENNEEDLDGIYEFLRNVIMDISLLKELGINEKDLKLINENNLSNFFKYKFIIKENNIKKNGYFNIFIKNYNEILKNDKEIIKKFLEQFEVFGKPNDPYIKIPLKVYNKLI